MPIRLKDIAQATGFSVNTVSLALNNSNRISEETKAIIRQEAARMRYIPNKVAKSLVTKKSHIAGVIVRALNNPILNAVASELERKLYEYGYSMTVVTTVYPRSEKDALDLMIAQQVDVVFMFPCLPPDRETIETIQNFPVPVILLSYGNYPLFTDAIYIDKEYAAYRVTKYLVELCHQKIGLICGSAGRVLSQMDCDRFNGYLRALEEGGIRYNPAYTILMKDGTYQAGFDAAAELHHRSDVTAVYAPSDAIGCGVIRFFLSAGVRIPEDISVVCNDSTEVAAFAPVPITASKYDVKKLVDAAIERMLERLRNPEEKMDFVRVPILSELDIRESTRPLKETS